MADLYLDDCLDGDELIAFLRSAGHFVEYPRHAETKDWDDPDHVEFAAQHGYILLTQNPNDLLDIHADWQAQGRTHSGIFLIYRENIKSKDMTPPDIVHAIGNLLASGIPIANEIHVLNHWR